MAETVVSIRKEIISYGQEFLIDQSTDTIFSVSDNKDETATVLFLSYVRKGI